MLVLIVHARYPEASLYSEVEEGDRIEGKRVKTPNGIALMMCSTGHLYCSHRKHELTYFAQRT